MNTALNSTDSTNQNNKINGKINNKINNFKSNVRNFKFEHDWFDDNNVDYNNEDVNAMNWLLNNCLTIDHKLETINIEYTGTILSDYNNINSLLQIIIPNSPQIYELNNRLNNEITNDMKKKLNYLEIENIENKIKYSNYLKYNTININNLNNKKWYSNIKILNLKHLSYQDEELKFTNFKNIVNEQITEERIKNGLSNLKSIVCDFLYSLSDENMFDIINCKILNVLAHKLMYV